MILTIKHRFGIYKRFEKDIWGLGFFNLGSKHKLSDFFYNLYLKRQDRRFQKRRRYVYRIDVIKQREFKKRLKKSFVTLRIVKLFYLILKYKQFRVLAQKAAKFDVPLKRTTVGH